MGWRRARSTKTDLGLMFSMGVGPVLGFMLAIALPILGRLALDSREFAAWTLLYTLSSVGTTFDFGAGALLTTQYHLARDRRLLFRKCLVLTGKASGALTVIASGGWVVLHLLRPGEYDLVPGLIAVAGTGLGTVLRSAVLLKANAALALGQARLRFRLIIIQAGLQLVFVGLFLNAGSGYAIYPVTLALSSALTLLVVREKQQHEDVGDPARYIPRRTSQLDFVGTRSALGLLLMLLTQADRWIVGGIAGTGILSLYEIATRLAVIPKFVVGAVSFSVVPGAASARGRRLAIRGLYARTVRAVVVMTLTLSAAVCLLVLLAGDRLGTNAIETASLTIGLLIAHDIHTLSIPKSMFLTGLNRVRQELPYAVIAAIVALAIWTAAIVAGIPWLAMVASPLGLVVGSIYLFLLPIDGAWDVVEEQDPTV